MSPRRGDPKQKEQSDNLTKWAMVGGTGFIAVGLLIIVVVVGFALYAVQTGLFAAPATPSGGGAIASSRTKGDPNAKLEIVDWSDFQ